jgi:mono/diheme cytochrome c family protein
MTLRAAAARALVALGALGALAFAHPWTSGAHQPRDAEPDGAALYRTYCASCHGTSGLGDGPWQTYSGGARPTWR